MLEHGEQIIDVLGSQVDRIERNIKVNLFAASENHLYVSFNEDTTSKIVIMQAGWSYLRVDVKKIS